MTIDRIREVVKKTGISTPWFHEIEPSKWDIEFSHFGRSLTSKGLAIKPGSNTFLLPIEAFNYTVKPDRIPTGATIRNRSVDLNDFGNIDLQLSAHVPPSYLSLPETIAVEKAYFETVKGHAWAHRDELFTAFKPSSLAELGLGNMKYVGVFTNIGTPRSAPPGANSMGVQLAARGWSEAMTKVGTYQPYGSIKSTIQYADFCAVPASASDETRTDYTKFWVVLPDNTVTFEVPWTEGGGMFDGTALRRDKDGLPLFRKVGPQDLADNKGTGGFVISTIAAVTAAPDTGKLNDRVRSNDVFFFYVPPGERKSVIKSDTEKPKPLIITTGRAGRDELLEACTAQAFFGETSLAQPSPAEAADDPDEVPVLPSVTTPVGATTSAESSNAPRKRARM